MHFKFPFRLIKYIEGNRRKFGDFLQEGVKKTKNADKPYCIAPSQAEKTHTESGARYTTLCRMWRITASKALAKLGKKHRIKRRDIPGAKRSAKCRIRPEQAQCKMPYQTRASAVQSALSAPSKRSAKCRIRPEQSAVPGGISLPVTKNKNNRQSIQKSADEKQGNRAFPSQALF